VYAITGHDWIRAGFTAVIAGADVQLGAARALHGAGSVPCVVVMVVAVKARFRSSPRALPVES